MDHEAGQCVPVGLRQLTDSMIQQGQAVAIILDFYKKNKQKNIYTSQIYTRLLQLELPISLKLVGK